MYLILKPKYPRKLMKIAIYSDCHILAPHEVKGTFADLFGGPEFIRAKYKVDYSVLTGDIIDVDNAKKKRVREARDMVMTLKNSFGEYYLLGNHECSLDVDGYFRVFDDVLYCHGHNLFWTQKKIDRWERKKGGMSWWKFQLYKLKHGRNGKPWKPSERELFNIRELARKHNCKTVVFGHTHRVYDKVHNGIRIINVPKGRTIIKI
jgi:predicted phosphodiesterase